MLQVLSKRRDSKTSNTMSLTWNDNDAMDAKDLAECDDIAYDGRGERGDQEREK